MWKQQSHCKLSLDQKDVKFSALGDSSELKVAFSFLLPPSPLSFLTISALKIKINIFVVIKEIQ